MTIKFDGDIFTVPSRAVPPAAVLTPKEAARFINEDTTWEPGWKITAVSSADYTYEWASNSDVVKSHLCITMRKESKNSSLPDKGGQYTEHWELKWDLGVPSYALASYDALMYWVLEKITWCNEHETREFSRYKKDGVWYAPFQPHRGFYEDQHTTPEWLAQYRDPTDKLIAARRPGPA